MLTVEENLELTRVGPGTVMGDLMRRYWIPVVESSEVEAGGRPKRVKILGEGLVVYRAPGGGVGLVSEFCAHRRASLYFARNEERGLRCVYHGWQYDAAGRCLDMPNERPESNFQDKVALPAYPCAERGGVVWTYMGPKDAPPPGLPDLEWALVPPSHRLVTKFWQDCNYLQGLEGGVDPAHISFLHGILDTGDQAGREALNRAAAGFGFTASLERAPHLEVAETPLGLLLGARRDAPAGHYYWRITQYLLPFHTMPPADIDEPIVQSHIWVPMDDTHVVNWMVTWHTERPLAQDEIALHVAGKGAHVCDYLPPTSEPYGDIRTAANRGNDYMMDWEAHRARMMCGIPGFGVQDQAIQESQGEIVDRSHERLGTSDTAIIHVRRRLLSAARALRDRGATPPGLADPASFTVRSASTILPPGASWVGSSFRVTRRAISVIPNAASRSRSHGNAISSPTVHEMRAARRSAPPLHLLSRRLIRHRRCELQQSHYARV